MNLHIFGCGQYLAVVVLTMRKPQKPRNLSSWAFLEKMGLTCQNHKSNKTLVFQRLLSKSFMGKSLCWENPTAMYY